ncbi:MAG: DUF3696 domain-containing protein [Clostridia bacterium]|nr:DUF3696 domain-containing protein [Clostridia bacterium]
MLKFLQIENFKSLRSVGLPLERLNLLFGFNGMGKSSVIQSLLMLRQSFWQSQKTSLDRLYTNGTLINLGTCKDVFCQSAEENYMRFVLCFSGDHRQDVRFSCDSECFNQDAIPLQPSPDTSTPDILWDEALYQSRFSYLGAEHIGPREGYSTRSWLSSAINPLGNIGQYAVPFLAVNGNHVKVPDSLCLDSGKTNRLFDQVSAWMARVSPGVKILASLEPYEEMAKLNISYIGQRLETDAFTPINVGFGIPYVLPTIISLLISDANSLLMLENPESHLHPKGQTMIAELIARAASNGAQIFCESHSDHVINGVRLAVKNKLLTHSDVTVHYFDKNSNQETVVTDIAIDRNGNLSDYPTGLLDEWGNLMAQLV